MRSKIENNLVSGNTNLGIHIEGYDESNQTKDNQVLGNYIGTDAEALMPLGNYIGIGILAGAQDNIIGGDTLDKGNIISGNTSVGIQLQNVGTTGNQVVGNYIGTDVTGMAALPNEWGVALVNGPQNNIIGGNAPSTGNLISGNTIVGVQIEGLNTDSNQVLGNYIGRDATGTTRLANEIGIGIAGDRENGPNNNTIGGAGLARNLISGNTLNGIEIFGFGTTNNKIWGNYIGTTITGTSPLSNTWGILLLAGTYSNTIGSHKAEHRNIISGNEEGGIGIETSASNNLIQGNYIGTDVTGSVELGNQVGIQLAERGQNQGISRFAPPFIPFRGRFFAPSTEGGATLTLGYRRRSETKAVIFIRLIPYLKFDLRRSLSMVAEGKRSATSTAREALRLPSATVDGRIRRLKPLFL